MPSASNGEFALDDNRRQVQTLIKDRLVHWKNRIQCLEVLVENAGMETRADLHLVLMKLSKLEAAGKAHLEDVELIGIWAWDSMRSELAVRWNDLCDAFDIIWGRIRTQRTH
jgi:hypothetical protein